jgi:hypothetical protein
MVAHTVTVTAAGRARVRLITFRLSAFHYSPIPALRKGQPISVAGRGISGTIGIVVIRPVTSLELMAIRWMTLPVQLALYAGWVVAV